MGYTGGLQRCGRILQHMQALDLLRRHTKHQAHGLLPFTQLHGHHPLLRANGQRAQHLCRN